MTYSLSGWLIFNFRNLIVDTILIRLLGYEIVLY